MYTISINLQNRETKFKATGTARVRSEVVSEKRNTDGSKHKCHMDTACTIATQHILTAKSTEPFVLFVGSNVIVVSEKRGGKSLEVFRVTPPDGFIR